MYQEQQLEARKQLQQRPAITSVQVEDDDDDDDEAYIAPNPKSRKGRARMKPRGPEPKKETAGPKSITFKVQ